MYAYMFQWIGVVTKASEPLLDWHSVHHRFPWGVIVMFGGGFAMAHGFQVRMFITSLMSSSIHQVMVDQCG